MDLQVITRVTRIVLRHEVIDPRSSLLRVELSLVTVLATGKAMRTVEVTGTSRLHINGFEVHYNFSVLNDSSPMLNIRLSERLRAS